MTTTQLALNRQSCGSTSCENSSWSGSLVRRAATAFFTPLGAQLLVFNEEASNDTSTQSEECRTLFTMIDSLDCDEYSLVKPQVVVLREVDPNNFVAHMLSPDICASGDTVHEAIENLKDIVVSTLNLLRGFPRNELGPIPRRQLRLLNEAVK